MTIKKRITTRETGNETTAVPYEELLGATYNNTGRCFLVDTGAQVSIVLSSWLNWRSGPSNQLIQVANGRSIVTDDTRNALLHLGNHRYSACIVIADVK